MKKYQFIISLLLLATIFLPPKVAFAHVTVRPSDVKAGAFQTFNISVPVEKDVSTVGVRVVIPTGLKYVTPTVKQGWTIDVVKEGEGENAVVKEINWQFGNIPAGQRDDFSFSAQVPAQAGTIQWKAYQSYADGTVVSWDKSPNESKEDSDSTGPYSTTTVTDDSLVPELSKDPEKKANNLPLLLSFVAIALSVASLQMNMKKQAKKGK